MMSNMPMSSVYIEIESIIKEAVPECQGVVFHELFHELFYTPYCHFVMFLGMCLSIDL